MVQIVPQNPSADINDPPIKFHLDGGEAEGWVSSNPQAVTIDAKTGVARVIGSGVTTIYAQYKGGGVVTTNVYCGVLLIYAADGTLYQVDPKDWTKSPVDPKEEPGIPSCDFMTTNRLPAVYINPPPKFVRRVPAEVPAESQQALARGDDPELFVALVCYVLALPAVPLPPEKALQDLIGEQ